MTGVLAGVIVYVLAQFAVALLVSRRVRTEDDYLVAGRRIGWLLASGSVFATWFGAETCIGAAGQVYTDGLTRTSIEPFAYGICLVVMGAVFAAALWRSRITTLADLLRKRYSPGVERFAAVLLIPTSLLWAAAQIRAFGQVLSASSSLEVEAATAIAAGIAIAYTALGGLLADMVTDIVQGVALVAGLAVLLVAVVGELGGPGAAWSVIDWQRIRVLDAAGPDWLSTAEAWALPICGSVVAQEVISRVLAARSSGVARASGLLGGGFYLLVGCVPVALGLIGAGLIADLEDREQFLPTLALRYLSPLGYVLFAGALVSAILSTVDSALLAASAVLSRNLVLAGARTVSERTRLRWARAGVVAFGVLAWLLAHQAEHVMELIEDASGFGSAGILVAVSFALFSRRGDRVNALAALGAGVAVWVVGRYVLDDFPWPYLASLAAALLAYLAAGIPRAIFVRA
jgi:SSS family transporter